MLVMPAEKNEFEPQKWLVQFNQSLQRARTVVRRQRALAMASRTVVLPVALSVLWIGLARFTLLDIPLWPALLFPAIWLVALIVLAGTTKVTVSEAARFLDHTLGLDESVATCVQLLRETPIRGLKEQRSHVPVYFLEDTALQLKTKGESMPGGWGIKSSRAGLGVLALMFLLLAGALYLPTSLDQVRAERAELRKALDEQIAQIETLRADLIARPNLDEAAKAEINQQLVALEQTLQNPPIDRSKLLADITDAQSKLESLSPNTPEDFAGVVAAAETVQSSAIDITRNPDSGIPSDNGWDPSALDGQSDLAKAADAANTMSGWLRQLVPSQTGILSIQLASAQQQALSENTSLAQSLLDTSRAVGARDVEKASDAFKATSALFAEADKKLELAQAVQKSLASLDEGRQTLAKAGTEEVQKGQVGFRRPGAQGENATEQAAGTPAGTKTADNSDASQGLQGQDAQDSSGVTRNSPNASGANMGLSSPDYSGLPQGQTDANNSQSSGPGGPAGSQTNGQGGQDSTGGNQSGNNGGQSGNTAGSGTGSDSGTFGGQVTGPVGGAGGAISQVPNPSGQGVSTQQGTDDSKGSQDEALYVPTPEPNVAGSSTGGQAPGQAAPEGQQPGGIEGRSDGASGGDQTPGALGTGTRAEIKTPYKQVIGQYAEKATEALDQTYVPADAKDYVKDYFTQLGK